MIEVALLKTSSAEEEFNRLFSVADGKNVVGQMLAPQSVQREFEIGRASCRERV